MHFSPNAGTKEDQSSLFFCQPGRETGYTMKQAPTSPHPLPPHIYKKKKKRRTFRPFTGKRHICVCKTGNSLSEQTNKRTKNQINQDGEYYQRQPVGKRKCKCFPRVGCLLWLALTQHQNSLWLLSVPRCLYCGLNATNQLCDLYQFLNNGLVL